MDVTPAKAPEIDHALRTSLALELLEQASRDSGEAARVLAFFITDDLVPEVRRLLARSDLDEWTRSGLHEALAHHGYATSSVPRPAGVRFFGDEVLLATETMPDELALPILDQHCAEKPTWLAVLLRGRRAPTPRFDAFPLECTKTALDWIAMSPTERDRSLLRWGAATYFPRMQADGIRGLLLLDGATELPVAQLEQLAYPSMASTRAGMFRRYLALEALAHRDDQSAHRTLEECARSAPEVTLRAQAIHSLRSLGRTAASFYVDALADREEADMFRAPAFTEAALGLAYRPQLTAAGREVLLPSEELALPALVSAAMDLPTNDDWFPVSRALASWERDRPTLPVQEDNRRAVIRPSHPWWRG